MRPNLVRNASRRRCHVAFNVTNGPKRQHFTDATSATSANSGKNVKTQPRTTTLTFLVCHKAQNIPPVGNEIQCNSESDNETVTTADMKMDDSDNTSTSDKELLHVEPKPHSKRKLRKQH